MNIKILVILFFINDFSTLQTTKVVFNNSTVLNNGVYTSSDQILKNSPKYPGLSLKKGDIPDSIAKNSLIYVENGAMYVRGLNGFNKILIKGALSIYSTSNVYVSPMPMGSVHPYPYYDSTLPYPKDNIYFIDILTGEINFLTVENAKVVFARDKELFKEFERQSNAKKRKSLLLYITKFNNRNPIYIEKN